MILKSSAETRAVDAFTLSVIKAEKQIRKIFTFLIYQYPCFNPTHWQSIREILFDNKNLYFEHLLKGINHIWPTKLEDLFGKEYTEHYEKIKKAKKYRNKIFHGQLTRDNLKRSDLIKITEDIRNWCYRITEIGINDYGYDGFGRNSLHKGKNKVTDKYCLVINSLEDYSAFLKKLEKTGNS